MGRAWWLLSAALVASDLSVMTLPQAAADTSGRQESAKADLKQKFERRARDTSAGVDGAIGYAFLDLSSGDRIAHLDHEVFPTASTIKLAIVYELFKQVDEGRVAL